MATEPAWRRYERQLYWQLRQLTEGQPSIQFDAHVRGRFSGVLRQVDVLVEGQFPALASLGGRPLTMAVDCKCWNRPLDVRAADNFVGIIDDLGLDLGVVVTTKRASPAAEARIRECRGAQIVIVPPDELASVFNGYCVQCRAKRDAAMAVKVTLRHGSAASKGVCPVCGTPMFKIGG